MDMYAFHKRSELYCGLLYVYYAVVKSSRSLCHLLMSYLYVNVHVTDLYALCLVTELRRLSGVAKNFDRGCVNL